MNKVRFGIIGVGNMGYAHLCNFNSGKINEAVLTAVCDIDIERLEKAAKDSKTPVKAFERAEDLINSGEVDAILIATPHYLHPVYAIKGFEAGLHVLIEKPAGVYTKQVREMNEVAKKTGKVFGIMYNQRTNPVYKKVKSLIDEGELGEIRRVNWIITDWYRTQHYYDSGTWRATWAGEGGGVLLNQDPHQLDLLQWLCGMPKRVHAFCSYGKFHDIEVEDDVTAYFEYENGATGVFVTSTGDAPGTNRLEISGDMGKIIVENDKIEFYRNRQPVSEHIKTCKSGFERPEVWKCEVPVYGSSPQHIGIVNDFASAVLHGTKLLAPGEEGINGLTISNAIHLSSWTGKTVELPIDEDLFYELLQEKIKTSRYKKKSVTGTIENLDGTY
ncbi:MAG TPA: Gfo/Idh/MocA family oxidoreductase [Clostridiales bacterium]|nr:Gfo/Idh/MocA family oxidoreductase [Clostridiales bacterium]